MPNGLSFRKQALTNNEPVQQQQTLPSEPARFHPFVITREDGSRVHGAALTFYERVDDEAICSAMQTLQTMYDAEYDLNKLGSNNNNNNKRRNSQTVSLSNRYNSEKDALYVSKSICLIASQPFISAFSSILSTLYSTCLGSGVASGQSIEGLLRHLLYEMPVPREGSVLTLPPSMFQPVARIYQPQVPAARLSSGHSSIDTDLIGLPAVYDYDMFEFFRAMGGAANVCSLFTTVLLEHQIVLYSTNLHRLMLVGESLTTLLFPFTWLEPYVPIVPASNLHFIEAPVPYIMGFHHSITNAAHSTWSSAATGRYAGAGVGEIDKELLRQGQKCFVDIDSAMVQLPEGVPDFPDKNKFVREINEIMHYYSEKKTTSHASSEEAEETGQLINAQFASTIRELFVHKFVQMFASYDKFVIAPPAIEATTSQSRGRSSNMDDMDKENNAGARNTNEENADEQDEEYRIESYWLSKVTKQYN
jgi:hypothetical protein